MDPLPPFALQAARIGTWSWVPGSGIVQWDALTRQLCGAQGNSEAETWAEIEKLIHNQDIPRLRVHAARCLQENSDLECEFRLSQPAPGAPQFLKIRGRSFQEAGERRIFGACWDITEPKQLKQRIEREGFLLRALMEHVPDKIYFKDSASRFIRISRTVQERFGAAHPEEVLGKTDFDFFTPEHARQAFEDEQRILRTGDPLINLEEKETWTDGRETWVSTTKLPLRDSKGRIVGTFGISHDVTARRRAEEQLSKYTAELHRRNTELEEDLGMAREMQNALLPKHYPVFPPRVPATESALQFSHFFNPSLTVSGDFFDILDLSDSTAGVFICDVMGHGMRAALVAAIVRALVGELKGAAKNPGLFLSQLNHKLYRILNETEIPMFASAAYVVLDLAAGEMRWANAGHPDPILVHQQADGARTEPIIPETRSPVLGMFEEARYETTLRPLSVGDRVLLFTDGLFEVESAEGCLYDKNALLEAIARRESLSLEALCRGVLEEVKQFADHQHFSDDVCLVGAEVRGLLPPPAPAE